MSAYQACLRCGVGPLRVAYDREWRNACWLCKSCGVVWEMFKRKDNKV